MSPIRVWYLTHDEACQRPRKVGGTCTCKPVEFDSWEEAKDAGGGDPHRVELRTSAMPTPPDWKSQKHRHKHEISN